MIMHWPQITVIVLYALNLGLVFALHGKTRTDKFNFPLTFISTMIVLIILFYGGFFGVSE